jgi:integrase
MAGHLLALRRDGYRGPESPVFASKAGTPLRPENVYRRALAPAAIGAGFKVEVEVKGKKKDRSAVSFHTFRHTGASLLFEAGRNVKQVQAWLGHADPGFTLKTYIHLMDAGVGDAAFLDRAVGQATLAEDSGSLPPCREPLPAGADTAAPADPVPLAG